MTLLVTTALEETWGDTERLVFLGEWCRLYDRSAVWTRRSHEVVSNHWDDRKKLRRDYDYLKKLHDSLLAALVPAMNRQHHVERPLRYWQMIFDPWLLTYVAVMWDRWECLRVAFDEYDVLDTIVFDSRSPSEGFHDYEDFIAKILSDAWNHEVFRAIIDAHYSTRCVARAIPARQTTGATASPAEPRPRSLEYRVAAYIDGLLGKVWSGNRIVIFEGYFSRTSLARLNLNLGQPPRLFRNEFDWAAARLASTGIDPSVKSRDAIALDVSPQTHFEVFLFNRLVADIPRVYVEGFSSLRSRASQIPMRPKVIVTATAHWGNEIFKLWSAERVFDGAKLILMEHGGSFPPAFGAMSFEEDIADARILWVSAGHEKHVRLPPPKLEPIKSSREYLAIIGSELPRYNYRADSMPKSAQCLSGYDMVCELYSLVDKELRSSVCIRPHPNWGWNTRQRLIDSLGKDKVSDERSYNGFLSRARLIVCTYPQTTFSEAMASGLPSLLLYPAHLWETAPRFDSLLDSLRSAQIVFHEAACAAAHISSIWADPDRWWNSPPVVRARQEFHRQMLALDGDWLREWTGYLNEAVPSA